MVAARLLYVLPVAAALLLAACSSTPPTQVARPTPPAADQPEPPRRGGGYYKDDGPGDNVPPDLDALPDAEPTDEPVHVATTRPYTVFGRRYTPQRAREPHRERGRASWYGRKFHGKRTANGETYDMYAMSGAHKTLPLPSFVRVTNLANGQSVVVRINDRGPFHSGRIIDLSYAAAHKLGFLAQGSTEVEIETLEVDDNASMVAQQGAPAETTPDPAAILNGADLPPLPGAPGAYVQLGAFDTRDNAEGFRGYVAGELDWLRDRLAVLGEAGRYRLHAGPYDSADAAREAAARIAEALKLQAFVVVR